MKENVKLFGCSSTLTKKLQEKYEIECHGRGTGFDLHRVFEENYLIKFVSGHKFVINIAKLNPKSLVEYTKAEAEESIFINCLAVVRISEEILRMNSDAEVIIIGSESGEKGSYDTCYFLGKAALDSYVRERRVGERQKLVLVAPSTIEDSSMTESRKDRERLEIYRQQHPKKRFLMMKEVAEIIYYIFESSNFITNQTIRLNGGKFARM